MIEPVYAEYQSYKGKYAAGRGLRAKTLPPTPPDIEGPFYRKDAPFVPFGGSMIRVDAGTKGDALALSGRVLNQDGKALVDAVIDVWHADDDGQYDNRAPSAVDKEVGFMWRCRQKTKKGRYELHTIRPGAYKIGPDEYRCAHVHVRVTAEGYKPLVTQLYFAGDKFNDTDHWFDARRVLPEGGEFDFVLERLPEA